MNNNTNKSIVLAVYFAVGLLLWSSCKTKHKDSEPQVNLKFYKDTVWVVKSECFSSIHGVGKSDFKTQFCIDSANNVLTIPFDIEADSVHYIFTSSKGSDTIIIKYKPKVKQDPTEYRLQIDNLRISKSTFDSVHVSKKNTSKTEWTDEDSIDIYL